MVEQYTLRVLIDDSKIKELEQRLNKLGGGSSGGSTKSSGGGLAALFGGGAQGGLLKNLGKLAIIAVGITAILALLKKITGLVIDSSPMLKGMLKLFNTSILMIFRPIGDFIGFFLRPLIVFFLRNIALPWYRLAAPLMRQWGSTLGEGLLKFVTNPLGSLVDLLKGMGWKDLLGVSIITTVLESIKGLMGLFNIDLGEISAGLGDKFKALMESLNTELLPIFVKFIQAIKVPFGFFLESFKLLFSGDVFGAIGKAWEGFKAFFVVIAEVITTTLKPAWDTLVGLWEKISDFFKPFFEAIAGFLNFFTGSRNDGENNVSTSGAGSARSDRGNSGSVTVNFNNPILTDTNATTFGEAILEVIEQSSRGKARYS